MKLGPPAFRRFLVRNVPHKSIRRLADIIDVMDRSSTEVLEKKKAALAQGDEAVLKEIGHGKDIMSILCVLLFLAFADVKDWADLFLFCG